MIEDDLLWHGVIQIDFDCARGRRREDKGKIGLVEAVDCAELMYGQHFS